ncbi:hypothetical protein ACHAWX_003923 [Stephanocyclus meneghinianus]
MAPRIRWSKLLHPLLSLCLIEFLSTHAFVNVNDNPSAAAEDPYEQDFFPPLIDSDDISYFFSTYDLDGLHWALANIFQRSSRNPKISARKKALPDILVARGGGDSYTSEYKLRHDWEQARYLVEVLKEEEPTIVEYLTSRVIPIYERVLRNIPPLSELGPTKGLYAFTRNDYDAGIASVYNKALYFASADELHSGWREDPGGMLNAQLDWEAVQRKWFGESADKEDDSSSSLAMSSDGVIVLDDLLNQQTLDIVRKLLLRNTHWYQTKTPLQFGKYVGAYIDDGLNDPIFLELAKALHQSLPRIMKGHDLRYMWAYKYDSEWSSGINLHADQAAVNVNIWLSLDGANLDEQSGGLVVYTTKPPESWDFESYNTNTDMVVEELLRPTNFANITVPHKPNRAVIFDSALFHQTDKYTFKHGYQNGRINLTFLFGKMSKATANKVVLSDEL